MPSLRVTIAGQHSGSGSAKSKQCPKFVVLPVIQQEFGTFCLVSSSLLALESNSRHHQGISAHIGGWLESKQTWGLFDCGTRRGTVWDCLFVP